MLGTKIKIAIVGIGRWGQNLLREFDKQGDVVWICHKNSPNSLEIIKKYPNIKPTTNLEDILNDKSVEAVVVATPTITHFEIAKKILEADKHLFLEKPGCSKPQELKELCEEAEKRKLFFFVGYEFVYHPALKKLKELIKTEDIDAIHFEWNKWGTFNTSAVSNLLSHEISIIKSFGIDSLNPKNYYHQKVISETDIIKINFENDKNIFISSNINRASSVKNKNVTIVGKEKSYVWNNDDLFLIEPKDQKLTPISLENNNSVAEEIKYFLDNIKENKNSETNGQFALSIWETLNKI